MRAPAPERDLCLRRRRRRRWVASALFLVALGGCCGGARADDIDWRDVQSEATAFLSEYLRIDTTNPPGNEIRAAELLASRFRAASIEAEVVESESGRGSVLARYRGVGTRRALVLLNHLDVVPAAAEEWAHSPFAGVVRDGYVHGRGAIDCKGVGVVEAMAMIVLKRSGWAPSRDILFLGTADEEAGGRLGAGWLVANHSEKLGDVEFVLNEGGGIRQRPDGSRVYEIAVAEKTPLWLRLTATGKPGHGSSPPDETAATRLVRALERIRVWKPDLRVVPEVAAYYRALSEGYEGARREQYRNLERSLEDPAFREEFLSNPHDAALVRNTVTPTVLQGSAKTNVIPAKASAELDCRLLPGQDPADFLRQIEEVVDDAAVELTVLLNFPPTASPADSELFEAISQVARTEEVRVVPSVLTGFTDVRYFRERGITGYGFLPIVLSEDDHRGVHGLDERLSQENLREGTRRLVAILQALDLK